MVSPSVVRIGHLGIVASDLDRSIDFYTNILGLTLTERFEYPDDPAGHGVAVAAGAFVRCDSTHHCISIFTLRNGGEPLSPGPSEPEIGLGFGLHHIAFELATPADLIAKFREFRDRGVRIVNARRGGPGNQPRFYVRDPDGHLLEFYWSIDQIGWDGRPREYAPIEEIDLEAFDFERFLEERARAATAASSA
jgi:catechol 2,3-dioxygenase